MRDRVFIFHMYNPCEKDLSYYTNILVKVTLTLSLKSHTLNVSISILLPLGELRCLMTTLVFTKIKNISIGEPGKITCLYILARAHTYYESPIALPGDS